MVELMTRYARCSDLLRRLEKLPKQVNTGQVSGRSEGSYTPFRLVQRLDAETRGQLVRDYESGTPTTELTKAYRLSKGSVLLLLGNASRMRASPHTRPSRLASTRIWNSRHAAMTY